MNRTGLFLALAVAILAGLLFAVFPQLDLFLARLFYNSALQRFAFSPLAGAEYVRRGAMLVAWAFAVPAIVAIVAKVIRPDKPLLISGRAVIFLLSTIFLTAIVLPDVVFKHHWGRPRPIATVEFNGSQQFKPWWDPRGADPRSTSFFSGEAATAFWTYAPAALAPAPFRPLAYLAATIFGLTTGILRMAFGAHYASDVIAAAVAAFLVTWLAHGLIYRWKDSRLTDDEVDRWLGDTNRKLRSARLFWWLVVAVAALTVARLIALKFSVVDLFPDEARYWSWSRKPAFGYSSKPPAIAWIIAHVGHICGNSEACLRAPAPLLYAATAIVAYFIAEHLYGERSAFWTGLCVVFATGVVYSARIISTDVALVFFWAIALLAYVKTLDRPGLTWSAVLGFALGFGLLAKYAMIYFLFGMVGASWIDSSARALWRRRELWFALGIAFLAMVPNLIWNATHDFVTFRYTWGNIVGAGMGLHPFAALSFLGSQFAVSTPILFAVFLLLLTRPRRFELKRADRVMISFALPPLALVGVTALITSAQANWAAPAAIAIIIVATAFLVRYGHWRLLQACIGIGLGLQLVLAAGDVFADRISLPFSPKPDVYHRTMGWKALSALVRQAAAENGVQTIATDESDAFASLSYYLRDDGWPIVSASVKSGFPSQSEPGPERTSYPVEPILYLSRYCLPEGLNKFYSSIETLPPIDAPTGPHSSRRYCVFKLSGARSIDKAVTTTSR
jgi:membrane-associated phospholipid phosphatase